AGPPAPYTNVRQQRRLERRPFIFPHHERKGIAHRAVLDQWAMTKHPPVPRRPQIGFLILALQSAFSPALKADAEARYNRDVLPIRGDSAFACHGFDKGKRKAGLRLDLSAGATAELDSGSRAIVPGSTKESALIERIFTADTDDLMPPKKSGRELTAAQKD